MKELNRKIRKKTAFTLVEMSIVILIASILITGLLSVSVNSITNANIKVTNDRAKEIYKAIGNYVAVNRRLPCPAAVIKAKSVDSDYGTEVRNNGVCVESSPVGVYKSVSDVKLVYGMVPIKALGLSSEMAEDGFGNKFAYIINQDFAGNFQNFVSGDLDFLGTSFPIGIYNAIDDEKTSTASEVLVIKEKRGGSSVTISGYAIMAIVSYGSNKFGAINANATTANSRSADAEEMENDVNFSGNMNTASAAFDETLFSKSDSSDTFDDIILFKTSQNFIEDFGLMFLMPCNGATQTTNGFSENDAYYGQSIFGSACGTPANGNYTKKCESYGTWIDVNTCP